MTIKNMSREIKFRIILNNKIWAYERIGKNGTWENMILECNPDNGSERWSPITINTPDCIRQQYSGLKDKNGKEIYEGDFIKFMGKWDEEGNVLPPDYKPYKVVWLMGGLHALLPVGPRSFRRHNECLGVGHTDSKIIGNIMETPELWKFEHEN
jgi:uncharacterized phage protein (TIGR01671 family)